MASAWLVNDGGVGRAGSGGGGGCLLSACPACHRCLCHCLYHTCTRTAHTLHHLDPALTASACTLCTLPALHLPSHRAPTFLSPLCLPPMKAEERKKDRGQASRADGRRTVNRTDAATGRTQDPQSPHPTHLPTLHHTCLLLLGSSPCWEEEDEGQGPTPFPYCQPPHHLHTTTPHLCPHLTHTLPSLETAPPHTRTRTTCRPAPIPTNSGCGGQPACLPWSFLPACPYAGTRVTATSPLRSPPSAGACHYNRPTFLYRPVPALLPYHTKHYSARSCHYLPTTLPFLQPHTEFALPVPSTPHLYLCIPPALSLSLPGQRLHATHIPLWTFCNLCAWVAIVQRLPLPRLHPLPLRTPPHTTPTHTLPAHPRLSITTCRAWQPPSTFYARPLQNNLYCRIYPCLGGGLAG